MHVGEKIYKIVFCRIESMAKHPNADTLTICQVDAGKYGKLQIITAATNVFEGALVPVAVDGATLNNGERIFNGKLRGEPSYGMFCSGEELGITDTYYDGASVNGILIFNEDYPLGEEVKEALELEDYIFDISVTANRPDCQSVLGLAREISAVLNRPLKLPDFTYKADKNVKTADKIKVRVKDADLCPRYVAAYVCGVKIEKSPYWLRRRLFRMGINSINNVVDITNYVLLETGQPMHAFDYRYLEGGEINVRRASRGEKIVTLDEKEFTLNPENLVICDLNKPVALAGIMGGLNSEIKDDTSEIVFESAKFKRDNVRKTSRSLGQRSDSSARFEKGVDAYTTELAMRRALNLIRTLNAGTVAEGIADVNYEKAEANLIKTEFGKINALLGVSVPEEEVVSILERLDFKVNTDGKKLEVTVPPYREDVAGYPDLAEEVIREYGYDHINCTLFEGSSVTDGGKTLTQAREDALREYFVSAGYYETVTYSFVSDKYFELYGIDAAKAVKLKNPLGEDFSLMRTSLVPSLVNVAIKNLNKNNNNGKFFEYAAVYIPKALPLAELPEERKTVCLAAYGEGVDFFTVKGDIEQFLAALDCGAKVSFEAENIGYMHPGRTAAIKLNDEKVGYLGEINPELSEKLGTDKRIYVAEICFSSVEKYSRDKVSFKAIAKFPSVERDFALLADKTLTNAQIVECIESAGVKNMESVELFDVYTGANLPAGKKSMAYRIKFTALDRTLSVEDVEKYTAKILKNLKEKLNVEIR
ncbi:MAG: phenylalanine--tRNA ligase subunit beta [Clostridia bacterium]|nr:phenylalanine--tRNA ligase subunit beta [Clostridia bacterium]